MNTKKLLLALVLSLCTLFAVSASALADAPYTEQITTVFREGEEAGGLTLRFYDETPHVPYLGVRAYSLYMRNQPLTLRENEDGTCALINGIGVEMLCDAGAGTIFIQDWNRFFDLPLPLENDAGGWKDTKVPFVRITGVDYEGEAAPVTLDFAKYGVRIYADRDDVYLPVSMLSSMMTDIATYHLLYNGENLYAERLSLSGEGPEGLFSSERLQAEIQGQERPEDIVRQCYAELCFNFDTFFGHPGKAALDEELAEKGLDRILTEMEEEGSSLWKDLLSPNLTDYLCAMNKLFMGGLADGHTIFSGLMELRLDPAFASDSSMTERLSTNIFTYTMNSPIYMKQLLHQTIPVQRAMIWGEESYREYGSTAIIRLDSFMPDEEAWAAFYSGEGAFPEDPFGTVVSGLRRASENPKIENVILDLSCNEGGSSDMLMAILAMTTGQTQINGRQKLTGQWMTLSFETDTNFDGVFDDKDREIRYDFNYGVLVSRYAFSCGNLCPVLMQEGGAVLIGEPSSGGSCCVRVGSDSEGFRYMMSSAQWQLCDSQDGDIEGGCRIDLPIEPVPSEMFDLLVAMFGSEIDEGLPSFADYYDDAKLDEMMNDWFGAALDLAA